MGNVVTPGQGVIQEHAKKLHHSNLFNGKTINIQLQVTINFLRDEWISIHFDFRALRFRPFFSIQMLAKLKQS